MSEVMSSMHCPYQPPPPQKPCKHCRVRCQETFLFCRKSSIFGFSGFQKAVIIEEETAYQVVREKACRLHC